MIEIRNLRELKYFIRENNLSTKELIKVIESCLTVWFVNEYTNKEIIQIIEEITAKYTALPERPLFI